MWINPLMVCDVEDPKAWELDSSLRRFDRVVENQAKVKVVSVCISQELFLMHVSW